MGNKLKTDYRESICQGCFHRSETKVRESKLISYRPSLIDGLLPLPPTSISRPTALNAFCPAAVAPPSGCRRPLFRFGCILSCCRRPLPFLDASCPAAVAPPFGCTALEAYYPAAVAPPGITLVRPPRPPKRSANHLAIRLVCRRIKSFNQTKKTT